MRPGGHAVALNLNKESSVFFRTDHPSLAFAAFVIGLGIIFRNKKENNKDA